MVPRLFCRKLSLYVVMLVGVVMAGQSELVGAWHPSARALWRGDFKRDSAAIVQWHHKNGFPGARLNLINGIVVLDRGSAWVWAYARNAKKGRTRPMVFSKLTGIVEGTPVGLEQVAKAEQSLQRSGYFLKSGESRLFRDATRNRLVPLFAMEEERINHLLVAVGAGSDDGWSGVVDLQWRNIAGTARDLGINASNGPWQRGLELQYVEPWVFDTRWSLRPRAWIREEDSLLRTKAVAAEMRTELGFEWTVGVELGYGEDEEWQASLPRMVAGGWSATKIGYDSRNRLLLADQGKQVRAEVETRQQNIDNDSSFWMVRSSGQWQSLQRLGKGWVLDLGGSAGTLFPTKDPGLARLYVLGGPHGLLGHRPGHWRTRSYAIAKPALQWQMPKLGALHLQLEQWLLRSRPPQNTWVKGLDLGIGLEQQRRTWNAVIWYGLPWGETPGQGLLHMQVKQRF